ncbi:DNA polymerase III subunit delta' [Sneathiella marina]|uniref:DNA polymerase III subunit delta n=1 Tax=Sneathiella marina TaxID=2950108 RepID=A0ABY4W4H8_9PROT|nr:DNA polymerase III subunit delta' [Sneathiella marina]USG59561.1 DNA polymerase III subunit delta' [Sneathiella marina]
MTEIPASDVLDNYPHPQNSTELVGHVQAEKNFVENFTSGRFHHAWLVTGAKGVGKATFAYRAAKFLLSSASSGGLFGPPETLESDPADPAISLIKSGAHPNLAILKRQYDAKGKKLFSVIRVDDVRSLTNFFRMTAAEGSWRVVIIDTIDDMNNNAANAILKILEEPPEKTVFLLLSHTPADLLPTIRSRCRLLPLKPLKTEDLRQVLTPYMMELDSAQAAMLVSLAEGSPGKAMQLLETGGLDIFAGFLQIFRNYPRLDAEKLHGLADISARKDGENVYRTICDLYPWWISRLVRAASNDFNMNDLSAEETDIMRKMISGNSLVHWVDLWEKGNRLMAKADSINLDRKQVVLNLFLNVERMLPKK